MTRWHDVVTWMKKHWEALGAAWLAAWLVKLLLAAWLGVMLF